MAIDFARIAAALLGSAESWVSTWLPDGRRDGHEWVALNPTRGDRSRGSFRINLNTGAWADFATEDKGGDLISLFAYLQGLGQAAAAAQLANELGMAELAGVPAASSSSSAARAPASETHPLVSPPPAPADKPRWRPILPVPADAPAAEGAWAHYARGVPQRAWAYHDAAQRLLGYVCRFETSEGGKEILPLTYCEHEATHMHAWRYAAFPEPRPLYGLARLAAKPDAPVLVVEGEKCADAGNARLEAYAVVSWPGGAKAVRKCDWSALKGRRVVIWPDCDAQRRKPTSAERAQGVAPQSLPILPEFAQPGTYAAETIAQQLAALLPAAEVSIVVLPPPGQKPDGWDIADAIAEGWDTARLDTFMASRRLPGELEKAPARAGAPRAQAGGDGKREPDWELHGSLLRRFTLIERSDMAWDATRGYLWRVPHMRLTFGNKAVEMWLASPKRRSVDLERVVFDPIGVEDQDTSVNLFRGLEMKPAAVGTGSCAKLLELLRYLCGENPEDTYTPVSDWVLKWAAYALQNVGAKMRTAVVMYGPERTGKNLFWGALRAMYGRHGALITQSELEDKHNTWMSAKLFIIANEVVTRAEMSHLVGKLKHMVTEDEIYINPKMVDQRYERNHANLVFLSNELQPLKIFPGDERYMVIRTPGKRAKEFYREVGAEIKAGGAAVLMQYLLALELGEFDEFTVPIENEAKAEVIEAGLFPSQIFWREIKEQLLPLPYAPCLSEDLYHAYTVWCRRNGHKMPEAHNRFSGNFMRMNGVRRDDARVPDPDRAEELALVDEAKLRKRRLFFMGEPAPDPAVERQRVLRGVKAFRLALKGYLAEGQWRYSDVSAQARGRYEEPF